MAERIARVHWLRGNKGERTPQRIIVLDTEARTIETEPREVQALRCWVAQAIDRSDPTREHPLVSEAMGTTAAEIIDFIEATVKPKTSWRLFTHNLSYDLGLTRLPLLLLARKWQIGRHNLASDQPWAYLKRGGRGLWLQDSWSWLPQPLEKLGQTLGLRKPKLPAEADSEADWLRRCRADVEITATALLRLLEEWDRRNLGWWSITGPASGWNTYLHFPARSGRPQAEPTVHKSDNPHAPAGQARVLVVPDPEARAFERLALYSGRRDVWQTGDLKGGPWAEIDLKTAHLQICAALPLPFRRWAAFGKLALDDWRLGTEAAGLVAECQVRTAAPRYPLRLTGAVLHPVGQFATVLAGPEIKDAIARGDLISIGHGYGYHLGFQMRDWAQWALAVLQDDGSEVEPMLQVAVKGWSRSVPGRWGMTHARAIKTGPSHITGWGLEPITIGDPPRTGTIFHLAGQWTESINDQEADDSFPAVLAYIQSYCRLALNKMLSALDPARLASCNTEGAWVAKVGLDELACWQWEGMPRDYPGDPGHAVALDALSRYVAPLTVQLKQTAQSLRVLSPQHVQADLARMYSGIPRAAVLTPDGRYEFWTWPKLRGQIERGDPRGYVREKRTVSLAGLPVSRWAYEDGHCEPVEVTWSPQSGNALQPPRPDLAAVHGPLRPIQHPALRGALTTT